MLAGVAGVISDSVGVSPTAARAALVALSFFGGSGIVIYVAVWLLVPPAGSDEPVVRGAMGDRRTISLVTAVASALVVALVVASVLKTPALVGDVSPGVVALAGLVVVWRHAGPEDRQAAARLASLLSGAGPAARPHPATVAGGLGQAVRRYRPDRRGYLGGAGAQAFDGGGLCRRRRGPWGSGGVRPRAGPVVAEARPGPGQRAS